MTIWKGVDRQGVKYFRARPSYHWLMGILVGPVCREPKKGDRVITRCKVKIDGPDWSIGPRHMRYR